MYVWTVRSYSIPRKITLSRASFLVSFLEQRETSCGKTVKLVTLDLLIMLNSMRVCMICPSRISHLINVNLNVLNSVTSFKLNQKKLMLRTNSNFTSTHLPKWSRKRWTYSLRALFQILVLKLNVILNTTVPTYLMLIQNLVQPSCSHPSRHLERQFVFHIVGIASHHIYTKSEATTALSKLRNAGVSQFHITFAIEPNLNARQRCHNANELALFDPKTK